MKLAIWGAYRGGLLSDDMLYDTLAAAFEKEGVQCFPFPNCPDQQKMDFLIIGGGTMLGSPLHDFKPTVPFGVLGAGFRDGGNLDILKKAQFVYVRGPYSQGELAKQGIKADICGDPIALFSPIITERVYDLGVIIRQLPIEATALYEWIRGFRADIGITFSGQDSRLDLNTKKVCHAQTWQEAMTEVAKCQRIISLRCHPFFAALSMGIPGLVVQFEFEKVWDIAKGFGFNIEANVIAPSKPNKPLPTKEGLDNIRVCMKQSRIRELVAEICQKYLS